jgi:acyl-homoserine-lactone acylase
MRHALPLALLLPACTRVDDDAAGDTDATTPIGPYEVDVRYTSSGVPHIRGDDLGSVAYGMGWAMARDEGCTIADQVLEVRSERARFFGPDHADRDFGWLALGVMEQARRAFPTLDQDTRDVLVGFAAGYSRWVEEGDVPPQCAGQPWVRPIDHVDLLAYLLSLGLEGSGAVWVEEIGRAQPPVDDSLAAPVPRGPERLGEIRAAIRSLGSNGWALGRDRTEDGHGMLLSNTHFPSVGEKRWWESHLTVPGVLDVYGASLAGVPIVNLGFNADVAWTHTVSYAPRFVVYLLPLDPEDPTRYAFDGGTEDMTGTTYRIEVADGSGGTTTEERTLWRSRYGPVIDAPVLGWTSATAVAIRDVNEGNLGMFEAWHRMDVAGSLDELVAAQAETQAIPWVYTIAADAQGEVFFGDASRVPYLSDAALDAWEASQRSGPNATIASLFASYGVLAVDGSDPVYTWVEDPEAVSPGIVPFRLAPSTRRTDYVFNANDSPWLCNVDGPLTDYEGRLYGPIRTARSPRTRTNGRYLHETGAGTASGEDGRFTLDELEAAALSFRSSLVEAALPTVVARCAGVDTVRLGADAEIDVTEACAVLTAWDGRYTADARGAVLWRQLLGSPVFDQGDLNAGGGGLFTTPFDPDDPLGTPRDVVAGDEDPSADPLLRALASAVRSLDRAGIAVDVRLGDVQHLDLGDPDDPTRIGVPGGQHWEGTIGVATWDPAAHSTLLRWPGRARVDDEVTDRTEDGWGVNDGNSFVLAVRFTDDGPEARAALTYSQSTDWRSPHLADQGPTYAGGSLRPVRFREEDIVADLQDEVHLSREATP